MKMLLRGGSPLKYRGDVLVVGHHSDHRPLRGTVGQLDWFFNSSLSQLWKRKGDLLAFGQVTLLSTQEKMPFSSLMVVGIGKERDLSADTRKEAYRIALDAVERIEAVSCAMEGIPILGRWDMGVIEDLSRVLGEITGSEVAQVDLYLSSSELLASAREVFPASGERIPSRATPSRK
ncbi:MAG: hypothetical protein JSV26_06990 [bacterium]|nr:MAG: hypothetical protein JSV26_06990 [bacterium]